MPLNDIPRRGGSFTLEQLEAETLGQLAASQKIARSANPYGAGGELAGIWDRNHCAVTGVDPTAPVEKMKFGGAAKESATPKE